MSNNTFTDSDREAILECLATETRLKHEGKPHSMAVITACEVILRLNPRKPHLYQVPPTADQGRGPDIFSQLNGIYEEWEARERPNYWWNKD
jgi:hypothetical protein